MLNFTLTKDDYFEYLKYFQDSIAETKDFYKKHKIRIAIVYIGLVYLAWFLVYTYTSFNTALWVAVGLSIYSLFMFLKAEKSWVKQNHRLLRKIVDGGKYDSEIGPIKVLIEEKCIRKISTIGETLFYWNSISDVVHLPSYTYIKVGAAHSIILPKDKIQPAQFNEFMDKFAANAKLFS